MSLRRTAAAAAGIYAAYLGAALIGLQWALALGSGSPVWPASGIAFAALACFGLRFWPAVFLARLSAAILLDSPPPLWADATIAAGTTLGAVVPVWLIERLWRFNPRLGTLRDMLSLVLAGGALGATISAGSGAIVLALSGVTGARLASVAFNWWFGFAVGLLVVAPLLLSWSRIERWRPRRIAHFAACMLVGVAASALVFLLPRATGLWPFHIFPVFVWGAVAFRVRGAAGLLAIASLFAIVGAIDASGPLTRTGMEAAERVFLTQQFIAMLALTMLLLAAAMEQRRGIEAQARLAAIVASSPDAMISFSPDGLIRSWNKGAEALFGWREDEVAGHHGRFLLPDGVPEGGAFELAMREGVVRLDTVRVGRGGEPIDVSISANRMVAPDGTVIGVAASMRDIRARKRAERHQRLLINELNHRVKNTLAIVQGLALQSFKGAGSAEARAAFEGRLQALAAAHNLLTEKRWERAPLADLVTDVLAPYRGDGNRIAAEGPPLDLDPQPSVAIAMALHELATNAAKYGALSVPSGLVAVVWTLDEGRMRLVWRESGGPPVLPPARRGFGTRLIERGLAADLSGSAALDFRPDGLVCTIEAPIGRGPVAAMERTDA